MQLQENLVTSKNQANLGLSQEQMLYKQNVLAKAYCSLTHENFVYQKLVEHLSPPVSVNFFNEVLNTKYKNLQEVRDFLRHEEREKLHIYLGYEALKLLLNYEKLISFYQQSTKNHYVEKNQTRPIQEFKTSHFSTVVVVDKLNSFGFKSIQASQYMNKQYINSFLNCLYQELKSFDKIVNLESSLCNFNLVLCNKSPVGESAFDIKNNIMYIEDFSFGTFVHEWFHYFDYRSGNGAYAFDYLTDVLKNYPNYLKKSNEIDVKNNMYYFTKPNELWARSFESWISQCLPKQQLILGEHWKNNKLYLQDEENIANCRWFKEKWGHLKQKYLANTHYGSDLPNDQKRLKIAV